MGKKQLLMLGKTVIYSLSSYGNGLYCFKTFLLAELCPNPGRTQCDKYLTRYD